MRSSSAKGRRCATWFVRSARRPGRWSWVRAMTRSPRCGPGYETAIASPSPTSRPVLPPGLRRAPPRRAGRISVRSNRAGRVLLPVDPPGAGGWTATMRDVLAPLTRRDPLDVLSISVEALGRYKLRTVLSVLGVVLGVAAVIAMMSVTAGARQDALRQVERLGLDNIVARNRGLASSGSAPAAGGGSLTAGDAEKLRLLIPRVSTVAALVERYTEVSGPRGRSGAVVLGVTAEYRDVLRLSVTRGRFLSAPDVLSSARVC